MKHQIIFLILFITGINSFSQEIKYNKKGKVKSVNFHQLDDKSKIPGNSQDFIKTYLHVNKNYKFKEKPGSYNHSKYKNETYQQYYKGIKVENARYSFHYKNDTLQYANGNFIEIEEIDVIAYISPIEARDIFAKYKEIPIDSITDYTSELLIKEILLTKNDSIASLKLVYEIGLEANSNYNNEIGYIDAKSGEILLTNKFANLSYTGTFYTRYSYTQYAKTMLDNNAFEYILKDDSRGTNIHTKNLNNSINTSYATEISDDNNVWTPIEHEPYNVNMGLDVHWALQKIYDYFHNYEIESFDNGNFDINAYIKYGSGNNKDAAFWHPTFHYLAFGEGYIYSYPMASLDVVAHEYGHAISDLKLGMSYDENTITAILQEGISDIWGVILENAILPHEIWKLGEQIMKTDSCARNIANPTDPDAYYQLITTYGSSSYNSSSVDYEKSGVMSYWFYLLVNGGAGTNGLENDYYLGGVGIDDASSFFTKTLYSDYLTSNWTFEDLRESFAQSALINGYGTYFKTQVELAWYAVGVGDKPQQQTILGSYSVCDNGGTDYYITNLLPGVQWNGRIVQILLNVVEALII